VQKLLKNFVENCLVLKLVPKEEAVIWERETPVDGATQRAEKIARNKRKKEAEAALQFIMKRKQTTNDGEELEEGLDEELERYAPDKLCCDNTRSLSIFLIF
jgi:hypothetical protein